VSPGLRPAGAGGAACPGTAPAATTATRSRANSPCVVYLHAGQIHEGGPVSDIRYRVSSRLATCLPGLCIYARAARQRVRRQPGVLNKKDSLSQNHTTGPWA
jgi:hypothetical protein